MLHLSLQCALRCALLISGGAGFPVGGRYVLTETHKTSASLERHVPASAGEGGSQLVEVEEDSGAVVHLQTYRSNQRRFIVAADAKGEITVFKENGTLHGTAQVRRALPPSSAYAHVAGVHLALCAF
jgi:hypothetical protein